MMRRLDRNQINWLFVCIVNPLNFTARSLFEISPKSFYVYVRLCVRVSARARFCSSPNTHKHFWFCIQVSQASFTTTTMAIYFVGALCATIIKIHHNHKHIDIDTEQASSRRAHTHTKKEHQQQNQQLGQREYSHISNRICSRSDIAQKRNLKRSSNNEHSMQPPDQKLPRHIIHIDTIQIKQKFSSNRRNEKKKKHKNKRETKKIAQFGIGSKWPRK